MSDLSKRTIGELVDLLTTSVIKCFMAQEDIMNEDLDEHARFEAAKRAQIMNARRSALIRAIDEYFGQLDSSVTPKTYYTYFEDKK
jgi:hypothetical protein